jgi:hypothetical protein
MSPDDHTPTSGSTDGHTSKSAGSKVRDWLRRLALQPLGGNPPPRDDGAESAIDAWVLGDVEGAIGGGIWLLSRLRRRLRRRRVAVPMEPTGPTEPGAATPPADI